MEEMKMPALTGSAAHRLDDEAATRSIREIAAYLQEAVGQRVAAAMAGLSDAKQIGRYARENGPQPHGNTERRRRHRPPGCRARHSCLGRFRFAGFDRGLDDECKSAPPAGAATRPQSPR